MECPRGCGKVAIVDKTWGVMPCSDCVALDRETTLKSAPEFATQSQTDRIRADRDAAAKDTLQPWDSKGGINRDFVENYRDKAKNYFKEEDLRKL